MADLVFASLGWRVWYVRLNEVDCILPSSSKGVFAVEMRVIDKVDFVVVCCLGL